jgi:hypothetical protein
MGELTKSQYVMRRQALEAEVERIGPPIDPDIAKAEGLLDDFAQFWTIEDAPAERHKLLAQLLDRVWQDGGSIVAVKPRAPFARYFQTVADIQAVRDPRDSGRSARVSFTGATGLEPATSGVTGRRSNQLSYAPERVGMRSVAGDPEHLSPPRPGLHRGGECSCLLPNLHGQHSRAVALGAEVARPLGHEAVRAAADAPARGV